MALISLTILTTPYERDTCIYVFGYIIYSYIHNTMHDSQKRQFHHHSYRKSKVVIHHPCDLKFLDY